MSFLYWRHYYAMLRNFQKGANPTFTYEIQIGVWRISVYIGFVKIEWPITHGR